MMISEGQSAMVNILLERKDFLPQLRLWFAF